MTAPGEPTAELKPKSGPQPPAGHRLADSSTSRTSRHTPSVSSRSDSPDGMLTLPVVTDPASRARPASWPTPAPTGRTGPRWRGRTCRTQSQRTAPAPVASPSLHQPDTDTYLLRAHRTRFAQGEPLGCHHPNPFVELSALIRQTALRIPDATGVRRRSSPVSSYDNPSSRSVVRPRRHRLELPPRWLHTAAAPWSAWSSDGRSRSRRQTQ